MTALVVALAVIGALTVAGMVGLAVWCWLFENDGERRRSRTVRIEIKPDTSAFVVAVKRAQRNTEKAARQLGGWR